MSIRQTPNRLLHTGQAASLMFRVEIPILRPGVLRWSHYTGGLPAVFKKIMVTLLLVVLGLSIWVGFALWSGIYSIYSYPPGKEYPDGATMLVSRAEGEPMFNSPQYVAPPPKETGKGGSVFNFKAATGKPREISTRTIVELPYIEWAYEKSLPPIQAAPAAP